MSTFVGMVGKKGLIKVVEYLGDGDFLSLGVELNDYFKDVTDIAAMVKTTIEYVDDGYVYPVEEESKAFEEYSDMDDFLDSVDIDEDLFYIYNSGWFVLCEDYDELTELEIVLEEV